MYAQIDWLDGPYVKHVTGTVEAETRDGKPVAVVVATDGAATFIPVDMVLKVTPVREWYRKPGCCEGEQGPYHSASPRCESGGYDHCSCDTCF